MDRRAFIAGTGALASGLAGCLTLAAEDGHDVGMTDRRFLPEEIRVEAGTTVVWKNTSGRAHTVTAYEAAVPEGGEYFASGDFDSEQAARDAWFESGGGAIYSGETYEHTFEAPGRYPYVCLPHESSAMVGTIVVDPGRSE